MRTLSEIRFAESQLGNKNMVDIHSCIVCGKDLEFDRVHAAVCGERCFRRLLQSQRETGDN